jgi:hypothetical protein
MPTSGSTNEISSKANKGKESHLKFKIDLLVTGKL